MKLTKEELLARLSEKADAKVEEQKQELISTILKESACGCGDEDCDGEEELEEISKKTLGSYVKKAAHDAAMSKKFAHMGRRAGDHKGADEEENRVSKRNKGISKAVDRLTKEMFDYEDIKEDFDPNEWEVHDESTDENGAEVFFDEETGEHYFFELSEDAEELEERKIVIRINSKGQRLRRITCGNGRVARKVNGRLVCVTPTGRERLTKKLALKRAVRTKKAKGAGYKKRVNFKRQRAIRKRKAMGL